MAPFGKIYSYPGNWRSQRAEVAAAYNGLEVTLADNFQMGVTNKTSEFTAKFPMGKVPALECADGFCLAESAAIAMYVAASGPRGPQLLGRDVKSKGLIAQWASFADSELGQFAGTVAGLVVFKYLPWDDKTYATAAANFERALKRLDLAVSGGKKTLVGDEVTLADIMVAAPLFFAFGFLVDAEMRKAAPNAVAYAQGLAAIPEFKKVLGDLKTIETRAGKP